MPPLFERGVAPFSRIWPWIRCPVWFRTAGHTSLFGCLACASSPHSTTSCLSRYHFRGFCLHFSCRVQARRDDGPFLPCPIYCLILTFSVPVHPLTVWSVRMPIKALYAYVSSKRKHLHGIHHASIMPRLTRFPDACISSCACPLEWTCALVEGSTNTELMTPLHVASLNLRMKIVSVLLKEKQVRQLYSTRFRQPSPKIFIIIPKSSVAQTPLRTSQRSLSSTVQVEAM